jgi:transposase
MIVIGLDVHKRSVTAVAVDAAGRPLAKKTIGVGSDELLASAEPLDAQRLWAVEDCRQLTCWLERQLMSVGEELVRVPPKLTVPELRAGRTRGKSDPIDALAIAVPHCGSPTLPAAAGRAHVSRAEAAGRSPRRSRRPASANAAAVALAFASARPDLRGATATARPPLSAERVSRWLARREQELVRLARDLVAAIRSQPRDRRARPGARTTHRRGCGGVARAAWLRSAYPREAARRDWAGRPLQDRRAAGTPRWCRAARSELRPQRHRLDRAGNRQLNAALYRIAITQASYYAPARAYLERRRAEGKSRREAIRCLKRQLARVVFNTLKTSPALT